MKKKSLLIILLALFFIGLSAQAWTATTMQIGTPMPSGKVMAVLVPLKAGIFKKNGLDVSVNYFSSGTMTTSVLISKNIVISVSGGVDAIHANLGGADIVTVMGLFDHVDGNLVVSKDITKAEQLKGKPVAISRFGANSELKMRIALQSVGLNPSKDVTMLQVGGTSQRLAALKAGSVVAAIVDPPENIVARKMGMNILVDLLDFKIPAQLITLETTREYMEKNPETLENFIKSVIEGIHYMRTHKEDVIKMMQQLMGVDDMEALEVTYNDVLYKGVPIKPYPSVEGLQVLVDFISETNPKAKGFKPDRMVETKFVEKLDRSGFIDDLYK